MTNDRHRETVLWRPDPSAPPGPMAAFLAAATREIGCDVTSYRDALEWSVADIRTFWDVLRRYTAVIGEFPGPVLADDRMPGARWYPDARINYAENLLRRASGPFANDVAIVDVDESGIRRDLSWHELGARVAAAAKGLRGLGVGIGDRVAAVLPNTPEALILLLAVASVGAVWSVCSPDLSPTATLARLAQLEPVLLVGSVGYQYNGRWIDRADHLEEIAAGLPTVVHVVEVGKPRNPRLSRRMAFEDLLSEEADASFERVPFDHPLWVLFTSGTTGTPKGIVHGHGGMVLEALKSHGLHLEMTRDDRYFVSANTSWMVWNTLLSALMTGASVVTYAGSPQFPRADRLFEIVAQNDVTIFGAGAAYLKVVHDLGCEPGAAFDLRRLRIVASTGSTLPDAVALWLHRSVGTRIRLSDASGGTEVCSAFVGGNPLEPVRLGRMQGALLGVGLDVLDSSGESIRDAVGEMVITRPMPAMPVRLWGDRSGSRYRGAYFEQYHDVWTHGDWMLLASDGTCEVLGRADATLNRGGVRLGSSEIYGALAGVPEVRNSLVIGLELPNGGYYLPLFVTLADAATLDDALRARINDAIRRHASARHVPDEIVVAPAIPTTHSGKRVEIAVKRLFAGTALAELDRDSVVNPQTLDWFARRATSFRESINTEKT
ncbi:acetoacetate--CoA ligase [Microbacterium sp. RD1]|uniref:acetoacetate--CoA ligase n=1 Tax=Microbacterium sp. RD1 TaxID=3457313 RepID=UPI003FA60B43